MSKILKYLGLFLIFAVLISLIIYWSPFKINVSDFIDNVNNSIAPLFSSQNKSSATASGVGVTSVDCGVESAVLGDKNATSSKVMICLGQNLLNGCRSAKGLLKNSFEDMTYEINKASNDCVIKVTSDSYDFACPVSKVMKYPFSNDAKTELSKNIGGSFYDILSTAAIIATDKNNGCSLNYHTPEGQSQNPVK